MTCKDCIHYEVCGYGLVKPEDAVCDSFKDKHRFIELPCKVGETIYFLYEQGNENIYLDRGKIVSFSYDLSYDENGLWFFARYESGLSYWHRILESGKMVFFTREEAEAKLRENMK